MYSLQRKHQFLLLLAITYAAIVVAFHSTFLDLFTRWTQWDQSQSHGLIILGLAAYLYAQRLEPGNARHQINIVSSLGILFFSLCWASSAAISINIIEQICLFFIVVLIQFSLFDSKNIKHLLGPVGLLIFAIPVWDYLTTPLMGLSTIVVTNMLQLVELTAFIDGNVIQLPYGTIIIADGCSGLRYFTVALALASYLILTSDISTRKALFIVAISISLGLIINWIRIFLLVIIGYETKMESELIADHEMFGWFLFVIVLIPVIYFARSIPVHSYKKTSDVFELRASRVFIITLLLIISGPILLFIQTSTLEEPRFQKNIDNINFAEYGLNQVDNTKKSAPSPDKQLSFSYLDRGIQVDSSSSFYWQKKTGDPLVPYMTSPIDGGTWKVKSAKNIKLENSKAMLANVIEHRYNGKLQIVLQWYRVGSHRTQNYNIAKLLQLPAVIHGENIFEFTQLRASCPGLACDAEEAVVKEMAEKLIDVIE